MPSCKESIHLPLQNAPPSGPSYLMQEEEALLNSSAGSAKDIAHRKNPTWFSGAFTCDDFRMYDFKVRRCMRGRSHDWTDCPFAHPGEKARRRDPRKIHYSGAPCPDFRKGSCRKGDACEYAHGVFECWLHPAKYRTQPCKDGKGCTRRVCFFAHSTEELRHVAVSVEESLVDRASVDAHADELYSDTPNFRDPEHMCSRDNSFQRRVYMVDSYEHEEGLCPHTNSPQDAYVNEGCITKALSMLTLSPQNVSGSSFKSVSTMAISPNNEMDVPVEVSTPSSNFPFVGPGPSDPLSWVGAEFQNDSFMLSASGLQKYTPVVGKLSSSNSHFISEHSLYVGGSSMHQAPAWQAFLMHDVYNDGESTFNASANEALDMVHQGWHGDVEMLPGYWNASGRGRPCATEVANESNGSSKSMGFPDQLAFLGKVMYEFSTNSPYGNYGLSSPTSTLAGPVYPSPLSSPPLSPLSTPSSETSKLFSLRAHGNFQGNGINPEADVQIQNRHRMRQVAAKHTFTDRQSPHSQHHSQLWGHAACLNLESPSFSQCTPMENKWILQCNSRNSEDMNKCSILQPMSDDVHCKIFDTCGGESPAETAMPDLGWVHELVM